MVPPPPTAPFWRRPVAWLAFTFVHLSVMGFYVRVHITPEDHVLLEGVATTFFVMSHLLFGFGLASDLPSPSEMVGVECIFLMICNGMIGIGAAFIFGDPIYINAAEFIWLLVLGYSVGHIKNDIAAQFKSDLVGGADYFSHSLPITTPDDTGEASSSQQQNNKKKKKKKKGKNKG